MNIEENDQMRFEHALDHVGHGHRNPNARPPYVHPLDVKTWGDRFSDNSFWFVVTSTLLSMNSPTSSRIIEVVREAWGEAAAEALDRKFARLAIATHRTPE